MYIILFIRYIIFTFRIIHKVFTISEWRGGGGGAGEVLHYFYSVSGFYRLICPRPPHFLSVSYAPDHIPFNLKVNGNIVFSV